LEDLETKWDLSVRDSSGRVVQFVYGNDGLDPLRMECGIDGVMDLEAQWRQTISLYSSDVKITSEMCASVIESSSSGWNASFTAEVVRFVQSKGDNVSATQLEAFLSRLRLKYKRACVEPGCSVGAICSQSVGEPATQMTLKTFHFAGIGANITLGVPRLTELINATSNPKTPITIAPLLFAGDGESVREALEPCLVRHLCRVAIRITRDSFALVLTLKVNVVVFVLVFVLKLFC
jgi:DNA-directed RNA polymerase III subunit RPC1